MEEIIDTKPVAIDLQPKKKISWKKIGLVIAVIAVLVLAYFFLIPLITGKAVSPVTNQTVSGYTIDYKITAENGDVIMENSTTVKPGNAGTFFGFASEKIDDALLTLKEGGSVTIKLSSEEAYGAYNESYISAANRTETLARILEINRTIEQPVAAFKQVFNEDAVEGKSYSAEGMPWNYTVLSINGDTVELSQDAVKGQFIPVNEILYVNVTSVTDDKINLLYGAEEQTQDIPNGELKVTMDEENIYFKLTPNKGGQITLGYFPATVLDYNETTIVLDYNIPHAGEKITAEITLTKIEYKKAATKTAAAKASGKTIEGAPTLDAFIVSGCPFGLQMQRILIPVVGALGEKANIKARYIGSVESGKVTSMHGEKEAQENLRQICIREEQPTKYWDYVSCYIKAGDTAGCLEEAEVADLEECMSGAGIDYAQEDFDLASQYSVSGSPTLILNGEKASEFDYGGRTADAVKQLICSAFTDKPTECDEELDTASAATSFSDTYSTGSSGAPAASCG